ncbi:Bug family tripartite tricarboxylate transporter substrate binding protein [Falsiroseomonas stagni]|uniref:Tripartite-type tricarboxylate transporter, receptor component TctC n=1 Tax=Falsiroseomonas stagni DSM 19981 TaxID=1123062 RepID=A0A1I4AZ95_9PROT|nr:tripartite tricarboxylate transporter substrate-binding protein [Falsiroseomonas stagni]SFK60916.1 Tripartite-type tricarboxylate transporter, receptor component TctC [Falsiroseomonas stagni DSM 19981]
MSRMKTATRWGMALAALLFGAQPTLAAEWPQRPVRLIVPYAPGGGTDVVARVLAQTMTTQLAHPVVVENRAGAGGGIGAEAVARSAPDAHTILFTNTGHSVLRLIAPNPNLDIIQALTPITIVGEAPMIMMIANSTPATNLAEFLALVRANPGRFDYGSTGTGGTNGLTALMFLQAAGVTMTEIPYRGGAPATLDLVAGRIAMLFDASSTALQTTRAGQARAVAVTTAQRSPSAPELPTLLEAGVPASMSIWMGIMVPTATPADVQGAVHAATIRALRAPELRARFTEFGTDSIPGQSPAESARFIASEVERWERLLRSAEAVPPRPAR